MNRRWVKITVATFIGLCLGWWMAGLAEPWLPGSASAWAEKKIDTEHPATHPKKHEDDKALVAAQTLIPTPGGAPGVPSWYPSMLLWVIVLFVFALGYGINRPSPADAAIEAEQKARAQEASQDQGDHEDHDDQGGHASDDAH